MSDLHQARPFHLGDILTVTTGRLLSPRHMDGVYDILNFLTRDSIYTHQIPRALNECRPWLLRRHPVLGGPEMAARVEGLVAVLDAPDAPADPMPLIRDWLGGLTAEFGETLPVEPIPSDDHARIDPVAELRAMAPDKEVVVIEDTPEDGPVLDVWPASLPGETR